jgi:hypothetical protein
MGCEDGMWMELAQDRVQWRALVLAVLNLRVLLHSVHPRVWTATEHDPSEQFFFLRVEPRLPPLFLYAPWNMILRPRPSDEVYERRRKTRYRHVLDSGILFASKSCHLLSAMTPTTPHSTVYIEWIVTLHSVGTQRTFCSVTVIINADIFPLRNSEGIPFQNRPR